MAKIKVWSVGIEGHGGYLERELDNVVEMLKEMQPGDNPFIIGCREIEEEKYEKLPEFMGW